jgi:predicted cupin superfamily sugar epimerase
MPDADALIAALGLQPHPEGGHYRETWRAEARDGERSPGSAIYYLLQAGAGSGWHRIDAAEVWHWYAGAALELRLAPASGEDPAHRLVLGPDLEAGQRPQLVVQAGDWQASASLGDWTLVGCTVSPAFEFRSFELAAPGWEPGGSLGPGSSPADPPTGSDAPDADRTEHAA